MNRVALDGCCTLLLTIHVNTLCERLLSLFMLVAATLLFAAPCSVAINKTWTSTPTISLNPWSLIPKNQIGIKRVQGRTHISVIWTSPDSVDVWHLACHALRLLTDSQHTLPFSHLLVAANQHFSSLSISLWMIKHQNWKDSNIHWQKLSLWQRLFIHFLLTGSQLFWTWASHTGVNVEIRQKSWWTYM